MSLRLPDLLTAYFAAENSNDTASLGACFADRAVVRDEGRTIEGVAAIEQWMTDAKKKYEHTAEPIGVVQREGKTVVTARVSGRFPNSPVKLDHVFEIEGDKITSLEIH